MERDRRRRGSSSSALNYFKKPFSWKLGALKLRRSKSTEAASFPVFDPSSATTFDHENCNFVSFNSELDSAVTQYLSQVTELGYRPTNSGSNLSTFKADWKDSNNSVASVNSRTSERLLAVQFQLHSTERRNTEDNQAQDREKIGLVDHEGEISREGTPEVSEKESSCDNSLANNAVHSGFSDSSSVQENYYENGNVSITDEPIYENLDGSSDDVFNKEPLYDIVPRRPQVPPKPESLARTVSQENNINSSTEDYAQNCPSVSEDSQCVDDVSGDSLSAESLSDSLSQDIERSSKRRKKKIRENTNESLIVDGSETSDLGSSGSEDVASIDEWLSNTPPKANKTLSVSFEVKAKTASKPESALELLEGEVLAEVEQERNLSIVNSSLGKENNLVIGSTSDDEDSSIQAINSSIVEVCRSHDEIDEARIIDDVCRSSSEDLNAVPAIRHSVIIELKGSDKEDKCYKHELKRSGSLHAHDSESKRFLRKNKSSKKKDRRMSETGLGICVGVTHNSTTNKKEFFEIDQNPVSNQIIEISEDGSWGLKNNERANSKLDDSITAKSREIDSDKTVESEKKNIAHIESGENKIPDIKEIESSKKGLKLPSGKKKRAAEISVLKERKGNMEDTDTIAAPPEAFSCADGLDGVFSASCVALTSEPNSLASSLANEPNVPETQEETIRKLAKAQDTTNKKNKILQDASENDEPKKHWKSNLGSAIMESYDKEMNKKKESLNLPDVSMLDFGQRAFDLELDRKDVIRQMIVKTKKKESWFGRTFSTDADAGTSKSSSVNSVKRSNSMSCVAGSSNKGLLSSKGKEVPKDLHFMNMKNAATKAQPTIIEDDIVFPSFMSDAEIPSDNNALAKTPSPIVPVHSIELTIKKLGIDELNQPPSPYKLNKHLTTITPFKSPSQNKHSSIKNIKNPLPSDPVLDNFSTTDNANPSESIALENSMCEIPIKEVATKPEVSVMLETSTTRPKEAEEDCIDARFVSMKPAVDHVVDGSPESTITAEVTATSKPTGKNLVFAYSNC
ncbi:hypothetical protein FHG87_012523 [Trinorchestia longiramus]|nr:hypothetical protein FHG87_012523 [Trinorchestia longiramus]